METKNDLIKTLKEQIIVVAKKQKKEGEKEKRSAEIDQLRELIS